MSGAVFLVVEAGPLVTIQDGGRPGLMRFGVPLSGPLDRLAFAAANAALGNPAGAAAIEVSLGGIRLRCVEGAALVAVAGGGFRVRIGAGEGGGWRVASVRAGEEIVVRPGFWGSWAYIAVAGGLDAPRWLGSASTHGPSGFGGGRLEAGRRLAVGEARGAVGRVGAIAFPANARPRRTVDVVLGPQERFFAPETIRAFQSEPFALTDSADRMGVRLAGPPLLPAATLDMPSEPVLRGSVQVAGDGVATVLLADHQTTGGYPKIATLADYELDAFAQHRPRGRVRFRVVDPAVAAQTARSRLAAEARYLAHLREAGGEG